MKHRFNLPIGDWSDDGHGKCDWFVVKSNFSIEELREAYFNIKSKTELSPEDVCKDYEDHTISKEQIEGLGLNVNKYSQTIKDKYIGTNEFADLILDYLTTHVKGLKLEIINDDIPMFPFYGIDKKNRHISFMGYGLFH